MARHPFQRAGATITTNNPHSTITTLLLKIATTYHISPFSVLQDPGITTTPSHNMTPDVHALEELLRYTFGDKNHLICAVSTSALAATMAGAKGSLIGEKTLPAESNGRMALLGASVLRVLITDGAFRNGKTKAEIDADIKSTAGIDNLHTVGIASGLQNHLVRNPGDQGEVSKKTMAQSIGAIIGAAFLDGGMDAATKVADALGQK